MIGIRYRDFTPEDAKAQTKFEQLLNLFNQLLNYTNGDAEEALEWMRQLDRKHKMFDDDYDMEEFINDLKSNGYLNEKKDGTFSISGKMERYIRQKAFEEIFSKMEKAGSGNHRTDFSGKGDEHLSETRTFQYGDTLDALDITKTLYNSQINHGIESFQLHESDLEIYDSQLFSSQSTVIMIDISHSMILYGEDRITPAKKVALGLSELIMTKYPKDQLNIIVFGDEAWEVPIRDLPYLGVGPYHTNTKEGLQLARNILNRKKTANKQIFMITDGKPSCIREGSKLYKNSFGLDPKILNKTLDEADICRRQGISITTFMIARDPVLQDFVRDLTKINNGRAYYSSLSNLGEFIFEDYITNRKKTFKS